MFHAFMFYSFSSRLYSDIQWFSAKHPHPDASPMLQSRNSVFLIKSLTLFLPCIAVIIVTKPKHNLFGLSYQRTTDQTAFQAKEMWDTINGGCTWCLQLLYQLMSWGSFEPFRLRFVHPCKFICVFFLSNAVSVWSEDHVCLELFLQMPLLPFVVWKLLLRRNWNFYFLFIFPLRSWLSCFDFPMVLRP